jgi:L-ascorbate metabolism protein UlaG (beta-lactamase superfamily)
MKIFTIVIISIMLAACAATDIREKSSHFNDGAFKNTSPIKMHSFFEMIWKGLTSDIERAVWPEQVASVSDSAPLGKVESNDTRVTFINHATFLIQTAGYNILTDPVFSERTSPFSFIGPKRIHKPGIDIAKLPKIDVIIISHDHYDHLDLDSINTLIERDNPRLYMGLGVGSRLTESDKIIEMDWWEKSEVADNFQLWFLEVQHFSGRTLTDRNSTLWGGFLLQINDKKIYFGGDSGYANHYQKTFERFGPIDLAFIPIGAYAPREMFKPIHLDPFEAVQAHVDLRSKLSIGMHYGTFQLSAEPFIEPIELLTKAKIDANIPKNEFITLDIGKPFVLLESSSQNLK